MPAREEDAIEPGKTDRPSEGDPTRLGEMIRRQLERMQQGPPGPAPPGADPPSAAAPSPPPAEDPGQPELFPEPGEPPAPEAQLPVAESPEPAAAPPATVPEPSAPAAPARPPQPAVAASKTTRSRQPARVSLAKMARLESIRQRVSVVAAERDQRTLPIDLPSRKKRPRSEEETREELLNRLLDPELTLAETAKVLDVCPATVRRYADRGILPHHRTPGNQRRFKLTDVLEFLGRPDRSVVEEVRDMDL